MNDKKTVLVIHKPTGEERLIWLDRFNSEIHELASQNQEKKPKPRKTKKS